MNEDTKQQEQQGNGALPCVSGSYCKWERNDFGMMGFHDYEYVTSCGKNYDCDKVKRENYCPNCGGKIV